MSDHYYCKRCGLRYDDCKCAPSTPTKNQLRDAKRRAKEMEYEEEASRREAEQRSVDEARRALLLNDLIELLKRVELP